MLSGRRCSKFTKSLPFPSLCHSSSIDYLDSAGILADESLRGRHWNPPRYLERPRGPGGSTSPGPLHFVGPSSRKRRISSDNLHALPRWCGEFEVPIICAASRNRRGRCALSIHGRRPESRNAHPPVDRVAVRNLVGVLNPGVCSRRKKARNEGRRLNARLEAIPFVL